MGNTAAPMRFLLMKNFEEHPTKTFQRNFHDLNKNTTWTKRFPLPLVDFWFGNVSSSETEIVKTQ